MATYEVVVNGKQGDKDMLNVFHYTASGVEPVDWDSVATVFRGHLADHIAPIATSHVTWTGITVRVDVPGSVGVFYPFGAGVLSGNNPEVNQIDVIAMRIKKLSQGLVRPTYGWFMQGGITVEATVVGGLWNQPTMDQVEGYAEDIRVINVVGPTTLQMVIKASNLAAPNTQAYSPVQSFEVYAEPRTQRTRLKTSGS